MGAVRRRYVGVVRFAAFKGIEDAPGNVVVVILCDPVWYV